MSQKTECKCEMCESLECQDCPPGGLKHSGEKRVHESGARRDSSKGKGRFDLIPSHALKQVALRFEQGAEHYGENNWQKGMPMKWFYDSAIRHLFAAKDGDTSEDHLAAAAWNCLCAIETRDKLGSRVSTAHQYNFEAETWDAFSLDDRKPGETPK